MEGKINQMASTTAGTSKKRDGIRMKAGHMLLVVIAAAALAGCAGPSSYVQKVKTVDGRKLDKVCVVTNYSMQDSVESAINSAIAAKGILTIPVNSLELARSAKCSAYVMYGGTYDSDGGAYLSTLRVEVFVNDEVVGRANLAVPNNLSLEKWSAGEREIPGLISQLFP